MADGEQIRPMAGAFAAFPANRAEQLKARARGALICSLFGSAWMYWTVVFSGHPTAIWLATVTLPAIALTVWAILRIRAFRRLVSSPADVAHWKAFRKFFWIDSAIEWALVGVGTFLLSRYGRYDLIPQLFGVIIGLHFLPLAKIFHLPRYYWVGGIMIVGEACSFLAPRGDLRNIIGCMSIGMTLWVTGVIILFGLWGLPGIPAFDSSVATLPAAK